MNRPKQRIGLMGGTFDPIHMGHLVTAEAVRNQFDLEKVIFIPAGSPPHKLGSEITSASDRLFMTQLAVESNPYFMVSTMELERSGPSFTIDTLRQFVAEYGERAEFYFIIGADSLVELHTWSHAEELLRLCHFVAAARPGTIYSLSDTLTHFPVELQSRIHQLATPELAISSTEIRQRMEQGLSLRYIVPDPVRQYIIYNRLYEK
ncbi:MAG: nicotinate-nucleotide adenylyltransferase [Sporomusaceae bacterium]|nr:nicotinate-nucleotide adenylyltransferase [Sporomusaceae bacterium]